MPSRFQKTILIVVFFCGWFALIAQFYLIIENRVASIPETIARYFSFFTILTNLLVAVYCTKLLFTHSSYSMNVLTALAVYITTVGIVYNVILRFLWNPTGLQWIVDELLHSINPLLFILLWFSETRNFTLRWKNMLPWLIYPIIYLVYVLVRGVFSGFYPYPFIDVNKLGYTRVIMNSAGLLCFFVLLSALFIGIGKIRTKRLLTQ